MARARTTPAKPTKAQEICHQATPKAPAVRALRSRPGSALIEADGSRSSGHSRTRQRPPAAGRNADGGGALDEAQIVVSVKYTKPGSPLDEYLRREQTRALLDLLADRERRSKRIKGAKDDD